MRLETLKSRAMSILMRDLAHMNIEVERGKLGGTMSRDLINYLKFLKEMIEDKEARKKEQAAGLTKLSKEELRKRAQEILDEEEK